MQARTYVARMLSVGWNFAVSVKAYDLVEVFVAEFMQHAPGEGLNRGAAKRA